MPPNDSHPALLIIDLQKGFDEEDHWGGNRNNRDAEKKIVAILNQWRSLGWPVFHILHGSLVEGSPLQESKPGFAMKDEIVPQKGEPVIVKNVNSAFIGTDLKEQLDKRGITQLVIVGLTTNHCISTTTRMAGNFGYDVRLIADATATFDRIGINGQRFDAETIHQTALASLNEEFAQVISTQELLKTHVQH
jgi:nicotinamidase-related amidase